MIKRKFWFSFAFFDKNTGKQGFHSNSIILELPISQNLLTRKNIDEVTKRCTENARVLEMADVGLVLLSFQEIACDPIDNQKPL